LIGQDLVQRFDVQKTGNFISLVSKDIFYYIKDVPVILNYYDALTHKD
jgi:hypothetical protein